jgi:hypothetical protein
MDLHVNGNGSICMVGPFDMDVSLSLRGFFNTALLQFFYDFSYFERYGRRPRGEYSHAMEGVLENYYECILAGRTNLDEDCLRRIKSFTGHAYYNEIITWLSERKRIQGHLRCVCGSGKAFRDCHPDAFRGLWTLHDRTIRQ